MPGPVPSTGPVLGIDSASAACSAAVVQQGRVLSREYREMTRGHAGVLMAIVRDAMAAAGCGFSDLSLLAATVGPGSFTGLRVCLSAARSMALAADLPVVGITTLEAVAAAQPASGVPLLVAIETGRRDVYVQPYASSSEVSRPSDVRSQGDFPGTNQHGKSFEGKRSRQEAYAKEGSADGYPDAYDDGRRGEDAVSGEAYALHTALCAPAALMPDAVPAWLPAAFRRSCLVAGGAGERVLAALRSAGCAAETSPGPHLPDAAVVARLGAGRKGGDALSGPEAFYLRPPDVTPKPGPG